MGSNATTSKRLVSLSDITTSQAGSGDENLSIKMLEPSDFCVAETCTEGGIKLVPLSESVDGGVLAVVEFSEGIGFSGSRAVPVWDVGPGGVLAVVLSVDCACTIVSLGKNDELKWSKQITINTKPPLTIDFVLIWRLPFGSEPAYE